MATYRKRGDSWRVEVVRHGVRQSATFPTKAQAVVWAGKIEGELLSGSNKGKQTRKTVRDAVERYLDEVTPKKRGAHIERYMIGVFVSQSKFIDHQISSITTDDCSKWLAQRKKGVTDATVLRNLSIVSNIFEIARKQWGWIDVNPWRNVTKPAQPKSRTRLPTDHEIDAICDALGWDKCSVVNDNNQRLALVFLFAIASGMRLGEICALTSEHVHIEARYLHLPITKNGNSRDVPLTSEAVMLLSYTNPQHGLVFGLKARAASKAFSDAKNALGFNDLHFHDSRALAATRLSQKIDVLTLTRIMGWSDPKMAMVYYRESASDIASRLG